MGAQAETQDWKTVLRHGGALPREAESRRETMVCIKNLESLPLSSCTLAEDPPHPALRLH